MNLKKIIREEFDDFLWVNEISVKLKDLIESDLINKIIEKNTTITLSGTVDDLTRRGEEKNKSEVVFNVKLLDTDGTVEGTHFRIVDCDDGYYPSILFGNTEECAGVFLRSDGDLVVDNYDDIIKELELINESKEDDLEWIRNVPAELPEINDENKFLILVELLGIDDVFGDVTGFDDPDTDFRQNSWDHYGIDTFTLDNGEVWAVGTTDEFDNALYDYWYNFYDDVGIENIRGFEGYLKMSEYDRSLFAQDMADMYVEDLSDEEVVENSSYYEKFEELEDKISELEDKRDGIDTSIDDQISDLEKEKDDLIYLAREEVREINYDEWYLCLEDPYDCLVNTHGLYHSVNDLLDYNNSIYFNGEEFAKDMVNQTHWGELNYYDGTYEEHGDYVAMRID